MAYDLVVLGIRGHPVPESRREGWRAFSDDSMEACGHGAIRFSHLGDLRQHGTLSLPLASLHLLDSVPYRATFLLSERLAIRGRALGRLLRALLCRFHGIRFVFSELKNFFASSFLAFQSASLGPCCRDCSQPSEPAFSMGSNPFAFEPLPARPFVSQYGMQDSLNILSVSLPAFHCSEENHGKIMSCHPFPTNTSIKPYPLIGWRWQLTARV